MRKGRSLEGAHHEEEMGFLSLCRSGLNFKAYRCLLLFFMAGLLLFSWTALLSVPAEAAPLPKNVNARPNSEDREPQKLLSSDALIKASDDAASPAERPFGFEDVVEKARASAEKDYVPPIALPASLRNLNYDQWRTVRFKPERSLWRFEKQIGRAHV